MGILYKLFGKIFFFIKVLYYRFGNGNILIGFEAGFIVCLSAEKADNVTQELFSVQEFKNHLSFFTISLPIKKLFSVGDNL